MADLQNISLPQIIPGANASTQIKAPTDNNPELARIEKTAKEFEALILAQLLEPIFATVEQSELTGGDSKSEAFTSMLTQEYAKSIAERGGLGIADQVKDSMLKLQAQHSESRL